jgi:hypothetical protein
MPQKAILLYGRGGLLRIPGAGIERSRFMSGSPGLDALQMLNINLRLP